MAKTPKELDSEAKEKRTMRTKPETLDKDVSRSGAAVSTPSQPRFDFDRSMTGTAVKNRRDLDADAVPQTIDQDTGGVRPKKTGSVYRKVRGQ